MSNDLNGSNDAVSVALRRDSAPHLARKNLDPIKWHMTKLCTCSRVPTACVDRSIFCSTLQSTPTYTVPSIELMFIKGS